MSEIADPLVVAALIDDDDDEEGKEITQRMLKEAGQTADDDQDEDLENDDDKEEEDDEKPDPAKIDTDKKTEDEENPDDKKKPLPPEAIDAPSDDDKKDDDKDKPSRAERRAERQRKFLERISVAPKGDDTASKTEPEYKPLDIQPDVEYDPADLIKDRQMAADTAAKQAADRERQANQEINFWSNTENQAQMLYKDPKYAFLNEDDTENFDEKKTAVINDMYLKVIGYEEKPLVNKDGLAKLDAKGNVIKLITTRRKDLTYDEFVKGYLENVEDFIDDSEETNSTNLAKQQSRQGVRPGGTSKRGFGKLRPGLISSMSDEEFEKNEAEIDRQINAELGIS